MLTRMARCINRLCCRKRIRPIMTRVSGRIVFPNMSLSLFERQGRNCCGLFAALRKYRSICLLRWLRPVWFRAVVKHGNNENNVLISQTTFTLALSLAISNSFFASSKDKNLWGPKIQLTPFILTKNPFYISCLRRQTASFWRHSCSCIQCICSMQLVCNQHGIWIDVLKM